MATKKTTRGTRAKQKERVSTFHRRLTFSFLAISVLLVFLIIYFSLSQVKIYITPQVTDLQTTFSVELLTEVNETLAGTNILPGKISSSTKSMSESFDVPEGTEVEGTTRGKITIINNYSKAQPLIKTTRFLTPDGKLFRLDENVNIPAGGRVEATVYADEAGPDYDIEPTKFTIPGLWKGIQDDIYGESSEKFTGGLRLEKTVSHEILDKKAQDYIKIARDKIRKEIESDTDKLTLFAMGGSTWETDIELGQVADKFKIIVSTPITLIEFDKKDLENIALNNIIAKTPAKQQFLSASFDTLKYELTDIKEDNKSASIKASVEGKSAARLQKTDLDIAQLEGKSKNELTSYLQSLPEISDIKVIFIPAWMSKVPPLKDHIYIEIVK